MEITQAEAVALAGGQVPAQAVDTGERVCGRCARDHRAVWAHVGAAGQGGRQIWIQAGAVDECDEGAGAGGRVCVGPAS